MNDNTPILHLVGEDEARKALTIEREPVRDWSLGPFTGHRMQVVTYLLYSMIILYVFQNLTWPHGRMPNTLVENVWSWSSLLWLGAVIPGTLGLLGELTFKYPTDLDTVQPINESREQRSTAP